MTKAVLKYMWNQSSSGITQETQFTGTSSDYGTFQAGGTITKNTGTGNNWYLWIFVKDSLENFKIDKAGPFYIDNSPPSVTNATGNEDGTITVTASDGTNQSGIGGYAVTTDQTPPAENSSDWVLTKDTSWTSQKIFDDGTYYVWVRDDVKNVSKEIKEVVVETIQMSNKVQYGDSSSPNTDLNQNGDYTDDWELIYTHDDGSHYLSATYAVPKEIMERGNDNILKHGFTAEQSYPDEPWTYKLESLGSRLENDNEIISLLKEKFFLNNAVSNEYWGDSAYMSTMLGAPSLWEHISSGRFGSDEIVIGARTAGLVRKAWKERFGEDKEDIDAYERRIFNRN